MRFRDDLIKIRPSTELRRLIAEKQFPITSVSGSTPQHAQIAESLGIRLFTMSGSAVSTELFGLPDAGLLSMTEVIEAAKRVCNSVSIPVVVDCDTGYGNPVGVSRTVSEVIKAGAAGFFIEDQTSPKRCGFTEGKEVVSIEDMVGKLRAAKDMRDKLDPDVVMMARTDARNAVGGSLDEVIRRGHAYIEAGADVLMVVALKSRDELRAVRNAFPDFPLKAVVHSIRPRLTAAEYAEFGLLTQSFKMNVVASMALHSFIKDYQSRGVDAYNELLDANKGHPLVDFGFLELTGFQKVVELEQRYLPAEALAKYKADGE